ncbi:MAG: ABC transporter ATP-binding protein [Vicinamibacterales bacterium]|nr:ABC transporter ATP-binding protein [Vicinamibacterales bacterium]HJN44835.1 ABC transporter ATP-binding protein [Vicinamibacterales bacterium]
MNPLLRLLRYALPHRARVLAALPAMACYAAASGGLVLLIESIFDRVLPRGEQVELICGALIVLYALKGVGNYFSVYLMADAGQRLVHDLRTELFAHILRQSTGFFGKQATGRLLSRITSDVGRVQQVVSETCGDLLRESLAVVAFASLLLYYDARLALVCLTGAPLVVYPLVRLGQRVRRTTRRSQEQLEHLSHLTVEAFTGHRIVQAFQAETFEHEKFERASSRLYRTIMKVTSTLSALPPLMELLGGLGIAGVLFYGSREIAAGDLSPGQFVSFMAALLLMYGPVKKLSRVNANIQQAIASAERIFETLDTHTETGDRPGARVLPPLGSAIEFRDVVFQYHADVDPVLRGVSFTVRAGQVVAVVGLSGAGKTTLINLVPRFYDVTGGAILIDDIDVRDVTVHSLRQSIGMVTQDTILFDASVVDNIAYAAPGASREAVEAVARAAHAHEFIVDLPDGYETMIGERGQRLSGGQRQRLTIARALLKNPPVLILDEATSALDAESELLVQDALEKLLLNRTAFVIAHRLSTIRRADAIIVLEDGRVVESGRHAELLANRDSVYSKLYATQLFGSEGDDKGAVSEPAGAPVGSVTRAGDPAMNRAT